MIELRNLVKRYGSHLAVDHLNLTIEEGKIYGFLGPNGAGKSTTMNMMTGYLSPTEGEIIINGHDILEEPEEAKKCIGYLPEQPPVYMDMTVTEYLNFCAGLKNVPKDKRAAQIESVIHMTRLDGVEGRLIHNLSKGYRQRVGLAQAILGFPPIIILDEPTVGLDPKQIIEIRDLIRQLSEKHTVILSSHILSEVQEICDQIIIISHGKLIANDSADHLETHLKGSAVLQLTLQADAEDTGDLLNLVSGVTVQELNENDDGTTTALVEMEPGSDPRADIFFTFARAKKAILEMTVQTASLEDVFLELTEDGGIPAKSAPAASEAPAEPEPGWELEEESEEGGTD
ncbi:MAG: ABC transporter ATP-binding protein [Clostridiales bacterium]|nr:ABC transporter ATP-binding protein [Clostridiales bacterium]